MAHNASQALQLRELSLPELKSIAAIIEQEALYIIHDSNLDPASP
jgi:hypothetical protein